MPSVVTNPATYVDNDGARINGEAFKLDWEIIEWGFYYYKDGDDPEDARPVGGVPYPPTEGDFYNILGSLLPFTKYYYRARGYFRKWNVETEKYDYDEQYGEWVDFTTHAYPYTSASYACAINKVAGTATFYGNITDSDGGNVVERGFEYGLTKTPTWKVYESGNYSECVYSLEVTGLALNKNFYVRTYVKSASGHYDYSLWRVFTTKELDYTFVISQLAGYLPNAYGFLVMFDNNGHESNTIALPVGHDPSKITMDADGIAYYFNYVNNADKYISKRRLSDGVSLAHVASGMVRGISIGADGYIYTLEGPWSANKVYKRNKSDLSIVSYMNLVGTSYYGLGMDSDGYIYVGRADTSPDKIEKYIFHMSHNLINVTTYENYNIIAVVAGEAGEGSFKIAGDHISEFTAGKEIKIAGSTGNNGTYTISVSGAYPDGANTVIPVDEAVSDPTADGTLTEVGVYSFTIAGDYTSEFTAGVSAIISDSTANDGTYTVKAGGSFLENGNTVIPVDEVIPDPTVDGNITKLGVEGIVASIDSPVSLTSTLVNLVASGDYVYAGGWFDVFAKADKSLTSIEKWTPSGDEWYGWFYGIGIYSGKIIVRGNPKSPSYYGSALAGYDSDRNRLWFTEIVGGANGIGGYPFIAEATLINIKAEKIAGHLYLYGEITDKPGITTIIERGFEYKVQDEEPGIEDTGTEVKETGEGFEAGEYHLSSWDTYNDLYRAEEDKIWWFRAYCKDDGANKYTAETWMKNLPNVLTQEMTNINYNKADGNGIIISKGASDLTERGFEVKHEYSGSYRNSWKFDIAGFEGKLECVSIKNGSGVIIDFKWEGELIKTTLETYGLELGAYSITIGQMIWGWPLADDCLIEGKAYKYRALASNEFGTAYGEEVDFSTPPRTYLYDNPPTGNIKNEVIENLPEGITASRRGFRYGTTEAADEFDVHEDGSFTNGPFSTMLPDLSPDTTYYIVAYIVVNGITYEGDMEIITAEPEEVEEIKNSPRGQDYREVSTKVFAEVLASQGIIDFSGGKKTLSISNHLIQTNSIAKTIANNYLDRFKLAKTRMEVTFPTPLPFERGDTIDFSFGEFSSKEEGRGVAHFKEDGEGVAVLMDQITMIIKKINSVNLTKTETSIEYVAVLDLEHE